MAKKRMAKKKKRKEIRMWRVGCHTYCTKVGSSCERRPTLFVRNEDGDVAPKCYQHSREPWYEVVAKIEWTSAAKRMKISMEGPDR